MMGKADAVIFDFDGVIADTREDVWDSVEYAANAVGGAVDKEFMEDTSHVALPEEELFRHINPLPPGHLFDVFCSHIKTHYRTMNQFHKTRMYPGLEEIFRYLAGQGTVWAVVSSKPEPALRRLIKVKGWEGLMPVCYSLDSVAGADTKQAVYGYLMEHELKHRHPVCIGDTWSDIAAARMCGFPAIAVLYGDGDRRLLLREKPDYTASDGWELFGIIKDLIMDQAVPC